MTNLLEQKLARYDAPQRAKAAGIYPYFRSISSEQDCEVTINGNRILMFGSNSYLGLTNHPKVKEAAIEAIKKYGTGCAGSRFLNGTLDIHEDLERKIAKFIGKEEAIIYSTGFQVNLGVVSCITGREDYLILDESDHASIIEGKRLSFSNTLKFKHNDMNSLEKVLSSCAPGKIKVIIVDGVFSMEGDVAPLHEIVRLAKKYDAQVMVDEAHGIGVFGTNGQGICHELGVTDDVDLIMGTFSKSFASLGGFIACNSVIANYLRHNSRSYIFSASATPAAIGAASAALDIMLSEPGTYSAFVGHYALRLGWIPTDGMRDRTNHYPDYPAIYPRQRKNVCHHTRSARRRNICQSRCFACRCPQRHAHTFLPDGYPH